MPRPQQLTEDDVRLIRREYSLAKIQGRRPPVAEMARRHGLAKAAIWQVANWISYKRVRG